MDDDSKCDDELLKPENPKILPITVDTIHSFIVVINILGTQYKFKWISIGTKYILSSLEDYKLAQTNSQEIIEEFKHSFNIDSTSVKEVRK